ncbi:MAG TPA: hypothetical protein VG269_26840 [Tepidisphaeraceae bacterium]|jgi:hypothetical protein|nr:hypothetical protein [Tepidisphaeraceae bacterium]
MGKTTEKPVAEETSGFAQQTMRYARLHWAWMKRADPAAALNLLNGQRVKAVLTGVGQQAASERERRSMENAAAVEASIKDELIEPANRPAPPPFRHGTALKKAAAEWESTEEGQPFVG